MSVFFVVFLPARAYKSEVTPLRRAVGPKAVSNESSGGLLHIPGARIVRTIVYVDGFNLYYKALKGTPYKWVNIEAALRSTMQITRDIGPCQLPLQITGKNGRGISKPASW